MAKLKLVLKEQPRKEDNFTIELLMAIRQQSDQNLDLNLDAPTEDNLVQVEDVNASGGRGGALVDDLEVPNAGGGEVDEGGGTINQDKRSCGG